MERHDLQDVGMSEGLFLKEQCTHPPTEVDKASVMVLGCRDADASLKVADPEPEFVH